MRWILFFTKPFSPELEKDGYFQRVKTIDNIFVKYNRLYVYANDDERLKIPQFKKLGGGVYSLRVDGESRLHAWLVGLLAVLARRIYVHSVLRLLPLASRVAMKMPFVKKCLDVHGVVPEEFRYHNDYLSGQLYDSFEELAVSKAAVLVTVSEAMKRYLKTKNGRHVHLQTVVLPMYTPLREGAGRVNRASDTGLPVVVYAGGTHKWQMIPLMFNTIQSTIEKAQFKVFVPAPSDLEGAVPPSINNHPNLMIGSVSHDELMNIYDGCHYGFALREDCVVNNVACPTKIVEYLQHGIVPILSSTQVGDFCSMGMAYLPLDRFISSGLPHESEREAMVANNREVVWKFAQMALMGRNRLKELMR